MMELNREVTFSTHIYTISDWLNSSRMIGLKKKDYGSELNDVKEKPI